jgi:hypothetical protein
MTIARVMFALLIVLTCTALHAAQPHYAGRPVESVLRSLEDASLQFLYSSELLPETLLVRHEPNTRDRLSIAREILAEHGLEIRAATPSLYVVIRSRGERGARVLRGEVVDAQSGVALSGARVELAPLGRVSWSDQAGRFAFDALEPGASYTLVASIRDYANGEASARLAASDDTPRTIRLQRVALDTVVVEASRYAIAGSESEGALRVAGIDLARQPEVAEDPIRALRHLPGVMQSSLSAASNLRGGETNEVLVLLDGFPLRQLYHLPGYQSPFSVLDEDLVGSIEAFTGGFPARYGNRLAGVFDIRSTDAGDAPRNSVGLSFFNARARMAGAIFVVGMPRSGTTLTEQILSSHPLIEGAGELPHIQKLQSSIGHASQWHTLISGIADSQCKELARRYLAELDRHSRSAARVVDKMPHNFLNLGFIALMFPKARVVHCRRDAIDNCVSIYTHRLNQSHGYSTDLKTLGLYYQEYRRLMDHWQKVVPLKIFDLRYEQMIGEQESTSRRLIDFAGLQWNDACLSFHETERTIRTLSRWQVRQPLYSSSVKRWKKYEEFLGPLIEGLGDLAELG